MILNVTRTTLSAVSIALVGCASDPPREEVSQEQMNSDLVALCSQHYTDCRRDFKVVLRRDDGSTFEQSMELVYPPIQNGEMITVFPGETIRVTGEIVGDQLINLTSVEPGRSDENVLTFTFEQMDGKSGMMLTVKNGFSRQLKYNAGIQPLDQERLLQTSSCSVLAGKAGFEMWPEPIYQLAVADIRFLPDDGQVQCR